MSWKIFVCENLPANNWFSDQRSFLISSLFFRIRGRRRRGFFRFRGCRGWGGCCSFWGHSSFRDRNLQFTRGRVSNYHLSSVCSADCNFAVRNIIWRIGLRFFGFCGSWRWTKIGVYVIDFSINISGIFFVKTHIQN